MRNYIIILLLLFSPPLFGQTTNYLLRDYKSNAILFLQEDQTGKVVLNAYGEIISMTYYFDCVKYMYQAQEHNLELGLTFFPKRIYSSDCKRFYQPDPLSQYFSSYLFVGADPVNFVDRDGLAGKPLVIYPWDHTASGKLDASFKDLQQQVGDAYYVPMTDIVNHTSAIELPEFNGNVYIDGHMGVGDYDQGSIEMERADTPYELKTRRDNYRNIGYEEAKPHYRISIDARDFGRELRDFANVKNIKVKNIVAGGCSGEAAAKGIGEGFTCQATKAAANQKLTTIGAKKGLKTLKAGDHVLANYGFNPTGETKLYHYPREEHAIFYATDETTDLDVGKDFEQIRTKEDEDSILSVELEESANGAELEDFVRNARVPTSAEGQYKSFVFDY